MSAGGRDGRGRGRRGPRHIAAEEEALWRQVARSVTPLEHLKPRVPDVETAAPPARAAPTATAEMTNAAGASPTVQTKRPARRPLPATASPTKPAATRPAPVLPPPSTPALPSFQRRESRRIATGRTDIEARLDLHGLTQSTAHDRLVGFLSSAAAAGLRTVLVITGKGGRVSDDAGRPWDEGARDAERGVLRRNVPRWLAEPALRRLVVSFGPAAQRHGGDGAFYIQLRRPGSRRTLPETD
jgi:DNA-nicking Smr family endonuclease